MHRHSGVTDYQLGEEKELLTPAQEATLADRIATGDQNARNQLVSNNLRLVVYLAKRYQQKAANIGLDMEELIAEGNLGLIHAADLFKSSFQTRFSTYATWWIKASIRQALREQLKPVRLPSAIHLLATQFIERQAKMQSGSEEMVDEDSVCQSMKIPEKTRKRLKKALHVLAASSPSSSKRLRMEELHLRQRSEDPLRKIYWHETIQRLLDICPDEASKELLRLRLGLHDGKAHTLKQASQKMGLPLLEIKRLVATIQEKARRIVREHDA